MKKKYLIGFTLLCITAIIILFFIHPRLKSLIKKERLNYKCPECNVILISIDTLRADHLHCYGYEREASPNIDKLARGAIVFENAISQSAWTLPSHASMLTGLLPSEHGLVYYTGEGLKKNDMVGRLDSSLTTLPQILKKYGYSTISYNASGWVSKVFGLDAGFDVYKWGGRYFEDTVKKTIQWLQRNKNKKFFFFLQALDVHVPYDAPEEFNIFYDYKGSFDRSQIKPSESITDLSSPEYKYIVSQYDAGIRRADFYLGQLFDYLDKEKLFESTIVIVTSDHGEGLKDPHDVWGHIYPLYEEIIRVPLIVKTPRFKEDWIRTQVPASTSILPTIIDILDIEEKSINMDNSLMNFFSRKGFSFDFVISETGRLKGKRICKTIRTDNWKLIHYKKRDVSRFELFDMVNDRKEQKNVLPEYPDVFQKLMDRLLAVEKAGLHKTEYQIIDEKTIEQLKSLGYIKDK